MEPVVSENGRYALVNGHGALVSAVVKAVAGDLASAVNSDSAWSESGSCLTWPSLYQICPSRSRRWAFWGYNKTHDC